MSFLYLRYLNSLNELSEEADLDEVSRDLIAPSSGEESEEENHKFDMDDRMITKKVWSKIFTFPRVPNAVSGVVITSLDRKNRKKNIPNIPLERKKIEMDYSKSCFSIICFNDLGAA